MPLDRARANEQLSADLWICPSVSGKPCDVRLLGRQLTAGVVLALAHLAPVASNSCCARLANPYAPIAANMSYALRS